MGYHVSEQAMRVTIAMTSGEFSTKDISEHQIMLNAHRDLSRHSQYHAFVGKALKNLKDENERPYLTELRKSTSRGSVWQVADKASINVVEAQAPSSPEIISVVSVSSAKAVRPGHYQTLKYMSTQAFQEIRQRMDEVPEFGGVYFRPLDDGVRMLDLHPNSPKPKIGIGDNKDSLLTVGTTWAKLENSIPSRIAYLKGVRARQTSPLKETQLEAMIIRQAQSNHLIMKEFPDRLRFIHSQWRIDQPGVNSQQFTDLLAVDLVSHSLVIIELKKTKDFGALNQAKSYLNYFREKAAELNPFFTELAKTMGKLYDCPELMLIDEVITAESVLAAWPAGIGGLSIEGLIELEKLKTWVHTSEKQKEEIIMAETENPALVRLDLGPQYNKDMPFTARMRRHQSWYRSAILKAPFGTGPQQSNQNYYGNMLDSKPAAEGKNFLTPSIFQVAQARVEESGLVEKFRLFHNMLSSQPMCFNIFGPLVLDIDLATRLFKRVFPGEVKKVLRVVIEYAPEPKSLYLNDNTAFDAFIEYEREGGGFGFFGIETKLTEPFSQKHYDSPNYRRWMKTYPRVFNPGTDNSVDDVPHNQLWRDHLLAIAMLHEPQSKYQTGRFILVHHGEDEECNKVVQGYQALLVPEDETFVDMPLDQLIREFEAEILNDSEREWLRMFRLRYLDLKASED